MRQILTILFILAHTFSLTGQVSTDINVHLSSPNPFLVSPPIGSTVNNDTIYCLGNAPTISCMLKYVNTSNTDTYDVALRRYIIIENFGSSSAMTYDNINFAPNAGTTTATTNVYNDTLYAQLDYFPNIYGPALYKYHFFNTADSTDFVEITVEFVQFDAIEECADISAYTYPNPATDCIRIDLSNEISADRILIYNGLGEFVSNHTIPMHSSQFTIDTQPLITGRYYYILWDKGQMKYRGSFIKQ